MINMPNLPAVYSLKLVRERVSCIGDATFLWRIVKDTQFHTKGCKPNQALFELVKTKQGAKVPKALIKNLVGNIYNEVCIVIEFKITCVW